MTEADIRRIAREEAQRVLREYIAAQRRLKRLKEMREQREHDDAMEAVYGPHGQG